MQTALKIIEYVASSGLDVFIFVLMLLSIKKCFWEEGRSKIIMFLVTLVIFPLKWIIIAMFSAVFTDATIAYIYGQDLEVLATNIFFIIVSSIISSIIFIFSVSICTIIGIIWLKFKKITPFLFLYTMYIAIFVTTIRSSEINGELFSVPYIGSLLNITISVLGFVAAWAFYRMVVLKFSELIKENTKINWKLFIIPPLAFSVLFSSLSFAMSMDYANENIVLAGSIFSAIIIFIFIWAFYVIIKNMIATNEAIKAKDEIKTLSVEVMEALAHTIDAKDEYTKGHSVRVAKYSRMLAEKLGLNEGDCESVYYMALLHDIGKIGVPNEIINSKSKMTDEEYAIMKTHPAIGSDILEEIKSRPDLMIGARWHHERYDGKGYPDQKAGEDIPYFARIISVADSYDAMTSNRSYRKFLPQDVVRGEIEKNSGTQFDPNVAKCMLSIIDEDVNYEYHE
jgi:putative nucleotidyltransferase with HDIG domain